MGPIQASPMQQFTTAQQIDFYVLWKDGDSAVEVFISWPKK